MSSPPKPFVLFVVSIEAAVSFFILHCCSLYFVFAKSMSQHVLLLHKVFNLRGEGYICEIKAHVFMVVSVILVGTSLNMKYLLNSLSS